MGSERDDRVTKTIDETGSVPTAETLDQDLDIVNQVISHRLRQTDIKRMLDSLDSDSRETVTEKMADILRQTSTLLEVSRRAADSLSLDVLLPRMVEIISEFVGADRSTLFLHDKESGELYSRVPGADGLREIRFPSNAGIAGSVFTSSKSVVINDAYADDRFNPAVDKETGYRTRNILCSPIRDSKRQLIGVAQVLNRKEGDFSPHDLHLLDAITAQAASAFVNAQLHEQIERARKEEAQLLEVTNAISRELHLEPLLQRIMDTVTVILNADRSTLFMYDKKTKDLWSRVAQGMGTAEIRFPSHLGIAGSVFTSGETVNIADAYEDSRFNKEIDRKTGYKTETILCMPVINKKGESIGVTQVLNKKGGAFAGVDERRLKAFSSQAAIAIENAQLFEDVINMKNYNEGILQSMSNGVITVDADGAMAKANYAALRLFRAESDPSTIVGKQVNDFFVQENAWIAESVQAVEQTGKQDVALDADLWLRKDGDEKYEERRREAASVNLTIVPLSDINGKHLGCMLIIEDITNEKRLRGTMARYMTKEVADKLLEEGESALGGQITKASVLFSDIRSFTSISERLGAQETVKMLNDYFSIMVDIILENGGILDKYIGDAMMAVFGAPFSSLEDSDKAVKAGIGMLRALHQFNRERLLASQEPVRMGLGINTDEVLSGNIGSLKRMDYTVIGDGVNLASRLEGANKPYGTQILISEFTVAELKGSYRLREVDKIQVKGKTDPVGVFEVMDHYDTDMFPQIDDVLHHFQSGLKRYRNGEWKEAAAVFARALQLNPGDGVSRLYRDRCLYFTDKPPPVDWDGVWVLKEK